MQKTFDNRLDEQFNNFSIKDPLHPKNRTHLYGDYIELNCLISMDSIISSSDIISLLDDDILTQEEFTEDEDSNLNEIGSNIPILNDQREFWINGVFDHLSFRASLLEGDYPFIVDQQRIELKNNITSKHKLYLILLIASNIDTFKNLKHELTQEFEFISYESLKNFLPVNAIVKSFGKNSSYEGSASSKIKALGDELNVQLNESEIDHISKHNTQEKGLDIIGWVPFKDGIPNFITILGQCTCQREWPNKQYEVKRYDNYFYFYKQNPIYSLFIPYLLTKNSESFYQSDDIVKPVLLFDRIRIIENITNPNLLYSLESNAIVERCLNLQLN